jgi:hypothetical protein
LSFPNQPMSVIDSSAIRERFAAVGRGLNERTRRLFAAVERPLRWVSKSHAKLAAGHQVSTSTIPKLLAALQYRRQVNRKATIAMQFNC